MINLLSLILFGMTFSFAAPTAEQMKAFNVKLKANMDTYCAKGSVPACALKKDPGSVVPTKKLSAADQAKIDELSAKTKACGINFACSKKLATEHSKLVIDAYTASCKSGSQDDCFWTEHLKIIDELQKSL